jgi:hypothetical protein
VLDVMSRRTCIAIVGVALAGAVCLGAVRLIAGDSDRHGPGSRLGANEQAVIASPVVRLQHGARIVGFRVDWQNACGIGLTAILDRRVRISDSGITATDADNDCHVKRRGTWSLEAVGVPSIGVSLNRLTHGILYIRPTWDAPGAHLVNQHWDGPGFGYLPGGD